MKYTLLLALMLLVGCNNNKQLKPMVKDDALKTDSETLQKTKETEPEVLPPKTHSNKRFKDVTAERIDNGTFRVRGKGQIFEGNFNWIVEDGHNELKKGFDNTDAGAPEWGYFEFEVSVQKERENSTLTLILFESSPKDGSRQHELPITLY